VTLEQAFLGLIALGVLLMAAVQVGAAVMTLRTTRRLGETMGRLEHDLRPMVANLQAMSAEAKRAAALAATQVERADRLFTNTGRHLDDTMNIVQRSLMAPAREGVAIAKGIRAAFDAFRDRQSRPRSGMRGPVPRAVPDPGDDDHASFIG
jgi:hypothetical protein